MKMTSIDDMNIVKDLFLVNTEPATEEETTKQPEIVEKQLMIRYVAIRII